MSNKQITIKATVTIPVSVTSNCNVKKPNNLFVRRNGLRNYNRLRFLLFLTLFTLDKNGGIDVAQAVTVDPEGNLYVVQGVTKDNPRKRISIFNACLKWERDIFLEG